MIPQDTVNLILETARIEDVVGDFVTLKRRGASLVACCPFHNEKTPSFYVTPSKNMFKCFGCGKGGSSIGFLMEHEHLSYVEALRYLADKYHIEIKETEETAEEIASRQHRESLMIVTRFAQEFFVSNLSKGEGRTIGYAYLKSRQLEDETIKELGLGWAPSGRTALVDAALAAGHKLEYLLDAGLAVKKEDGSVADKFRERVMFPIHSVSGRVIAFSGRTLRSDNPAKYVNSPDSEIYHKSNILMGISLAKAEMSRSRRCILVEGNVDMAMMHQLGIKNVVATCGTALTEQQVRLIHRLAPDELIIMYDGDKAGINAALKGINLVLREGMSVKIVLLPDGDDPDSFARKHTLEEVQSFIDQNARDFIDFKASVLFSQVKDNPRKRGDFINNIADTIADIPDAVTRSSYVDYCAEKFKIDSRLLYERVAHTRKEEQIRQQKERERRERYEQNGLQIPPDDDIPPVGEYSAPGEDAVEEQPALGPLEKEILFFLLSHGSSPLDFPTDSPYRDPSGQSCSVADFIRGAMENRQLVNSLYRRLYQMYFEMYDRGEEQQKILLGIINGPDRQSAALAEQLTTERYALTVMNFEKALTATGSWLVMFVPRTILLYNEKVIQCEIDEIIKKISSLPAEERKKAMKEIINLQNIQKEIRKEYEKKF